MLKLLAQKYKKLLSHVAADGELHYIRKET